MLLVRSKGCWIKKVGAGWISWAEGWNCCWMIRKLEEDWRVYIPFLPPTLTLIRSKRRRSNIQLRNPKEKSQALITYVQRKTDQLPRGVSAILSDRPTQPWMISLTLGALGLYKLNILASMMVSRVARVGVDATLPSYTVHIVRGQLRMHFSKALQWDFCQDHRGLRAVKSWRMVVILEVSLSHSTGTLMSSAQRFYHQCRAKTMRSNKLDRKRSSRVTLLSCPSQVPCKYTR